MAERQGLFQQRHISAAQAYGLIVLNHLDEIKEGDATRDAFRYAVIARSEFSVEKVFPEYFPDKVEDVETVGLEGHDAVDYSGVEWQTPTDAKKEWEEIMASLNNRGELNGDDLVEMPSDEIEWTDWQ